VAEHPLGKRKVAGFNPGNKHALLALSVQQKSTNEIELIVLATCYIVIY
jgi:hypothetical protein